MSLERHHAALRRLVRNGFDIDCPCTAADKQQGIFFRRRSGFSVLDWVGAGHVDPYFAEGSQPEPSAVRMHAWFRNFDRVGVCPLLTMRTVVNDFFRHSFNPYDVVPVSGFCR